MTISVLLQVVEIKLLHDISILDYKFDLKYDFIKTDFYIEIFNDEILFYVKYNLFFR